MFKKCVVLLGIFIILIAIYFPTRHARHYDYIEVEDVYNKLNFEEMPNFLFNLKKCNYKETINKISEFDINNVKNVKGIYKPLSGGIYSPEDCTALIKSAIIVPYRDRNEQLNTFVNYMHNFLQSQQISYRIYIVDQNDDEPFNRAKLLNYGAMVAMKHGYKCLILHDVDLIPLNIGNIYGCVKNPRHMSSSLDTFRFNLPYTTIFGGAVSITDKQFKSVNGMSNLFVGWGAEDDDFSRRLQLKNIVPCRFSPKISRYSMLTHKKQKPNKDREALYYNIIGKQDEDGLNQLSNNYTIILEKLYTIVRVPS